MVSGETSRRSEHARLVCRPSGSLPTSSPAIVASSRLAGVPAVTALVLPRTVPSLRVAYPSRNRDLPTRRVLLRASPYRPGRSTFAVMVGARTSAARGLLEVCRRPRGAPQPASTDKVRPPPYLAERYLVLRRSTQGEVRQRRTLYEKAEPLKAPARHENIVARYHCHSGHSLRSLPQHR